MQFVVVIQLKALLLILIEEFTIGSEGDVKWGIQCLHGKGYATNFTDKTADQYKVNFDWDGDLWMNANATDHILLKHKLLFLMADPAAKYVRSARKVP